MTYPLDIGSDLGRFQIEKLLGSGATAAVYLARDTELNIQVALKVLAPVVMSNDEALKRLRREIVLMRSIAHPSICRVFDLGHYKDVHFISMEYVPGTTMAALLKREGVLDVFRAVRLTRALCRALRIAHRAGIVHRDLKPGNIMVTPANRPVLMDFGFAATKDNNVAPITLAGNIVGTLCYMAPEYLKGQAATPASDQYSLAVTLYEAVTGRLPFEADSTLALQQAHQASQPVSPRSFNSQISEELAGVILKALSVLPGERFPGIDHFEQALGELVLDQASEAGDESISAPWNRNADEISRVLSSSNVNSEIIVGRIKPTTIFFSDIVGITTFFDQHGDIAGRKRLQTHHHLLLPLVKDHDGVVIKTIGDAIMAVFLRADDAVAAALDMQDVLAEHNLHVPESERIYVRMGIHSGNAIVERRDVFGDTVNVTARICSKAKGGQILVSAVTAALLVPNTVTVTAFFRTELKGKRGVFELFEVTRLPRAEGDTQLDAVAHTVVEHGWEPFDAERTEKVIARFPQLMPTDLEAESSLTERFDAIGGARPPRSLLTAAAVLAVAAVGTVVWLATRKPPTMVRPIALAATEIAPPVVPPAEVPEPKPNTSTKDAGEQPTLQGTPDVTHNDGIGNKAAPRVVVAAEVSARRQAQKARATLEAKIRDKGLVPGDHRAVDAVKAQFADLMRREQYAEVTKSAETAQRAVDSLSIDRAFVEAKISRFNAQFDEVQDEQIKQKMLPAVKNAVTAFQRGDYATANRSLNRCFELLASGRR